MTEYEMLLASITNAVAAVSDDDKKQVSNDGTKKEESEKNETIANLMTKVSNLEKELEKVKNEDTEKKKEEAVSNFAKRIANLLKNSDDSDDGTKKEEPVKNRRVKNEDDKDKKTENEDDENKKVDNFAKRLANALKNQGDQSDETLTVLARKVANILKNECEDGKDKKTENEDDGTKKEEPVKNRRVKNEDDKDKKTENEDDKDTKDGAKSVANERTAVLDDLVAIRSKTMADLIDVIVVNSSGVYSKEDLSGKSLVELQKLAKLLDRNIQNSASALFASQGTDMAVMNADAPGVLDIATTLE